MNLSTLLAAIAAATFFMVGTPARAGEAYDQAALLQALPTAKLSLQQGLQAATAKGRPISGKFEVEDGKLQLSVYVSKGGKFSEVIVDYSKGSLTKIEAITEGDDLAAAKAQSAALANAKAALTEAVNKAEHDAAGFRAVSVAPETSGQGTIARVTLTKGGEVKTVSVPIK